MTTTRRGSYKFGALALCAAVAVMPAGCQSPMERSAEQKLRDSLLSSNKLYREAVAGGTIADLTREDSDSIAKLSPERIKELEALSGPEALRNLPLDAGTDLEGKASNVVHMTLARAIQLAVEHNLEVQQAKLLPGLSQTQVTQAEAAFDPTLFANVDWQKLDTPRPQTSSGVSAAFGSNKSETATLTTGIKKVLSTGGEIGAQTEAGWNFADPSFFATSTDPAFAYHDANVLVGLNQPLLRNFGSDVTLAQVSLAKNARGQSLQDLRRQLHDTVFKTESAYWDLVFARQRLIITQRLLSLTVRDYNTIRERLEGQLDVSPIQMSEIATFVESRRGELLSARRDVRLASDALKRLINAPGLPLSGETLIIASDFPADLPIKISLVDAISTALQHRPELKRAILEIDDASIRMMVADNARLPQLNLSAAIRYNGVGGSNPNAYQNLAEGDFIDYLVGAQFEMPIGNRGPQAVFRQRQIEREAISRSYQRATQDALREVKDAMHQLQTDYELIEVRRATRLHATDNVRAYTEQLNIGVALTPEFLNLKLQSQQRLSDAATLEIQALTQYNTDIARLYQSTGTLLQRNNIDFDDIARENIRPVRNQILPATGNGNSLP